MPSGGDAEVERDRQKNRRQKAAWNQDHRASLIAHSAQDAQAIALGLSGAALQAAQPGAQSICDDRIILAFK